MRRRHAVAAGLVAVSLVLAGCGDDDDSGGSAPKANPELKGDPIVIGLDEDSTGPGASYSTIAGKTIRAPSRSSTTRAACSAVRSSWSSRTTRATRPRCRRCCRSCWRGRQGLLLQSGSAAIIQAKPVARARPAGDRADRRHRDLRDAARQRAHLHARQHCRRLGGGLLRGVRGGGHQEARRPQPTTHRPSKASTRCCKPGLEECMIVVADETAAVDASDVTAQVARLKNANPDADWSPASAARSRCSRRTRWRQQLAASRGSRSPRSATSRRLEAGEPGCARTG